MADGEIDTATVTQLIRAVEECKNYAFLIGAGSSRPSPAGILTGGELIEKWKGECYDHENPDEEFDSWVKVKEEEMDDDNEYGFWFEQRHPTRGERRERIQELVEDATPTFGHVLLASLMDKDYVPHVLTPNFDDLLFDAFYLYLEDKPQVIDHRAVAPEFRLTHSESAIVKLHGDYLYDNLRNTTSETESNALDEAMKDALQQTVEEYGLVVVGYSGGDDSIMDPLIDADISEYGIYWCTRDADSFSEEEKAEELLKRPNTYLVEIEGFGSLMRKFGNRIDGLKPPQPDEVVDRAEKRADMLKGALKESKEAATGDEEEEYVDKTEKVWKGMDLVQEGNYEKAVDLFNEIIEEHPDHPRAYYNRGFAKSKLGNYEAAIADYDKVIELNPGDVTAYHNRGLSKHEMGEYEAAIADYDKVIELDPDDETAYLNRAEVMILIGEFEQAYQDASQAKEVSKSIENSAISLLFHLIPKIVLGEDHSDEESKYCSLCKMEFTTTWGLEELDSWLEDVDLAPDKKDKIAKLIDLLREHKE